jgi:glycerol-3-phosphate acyltransferase PlsY
VKILEICFVISAFLWGGIPVGYIVVRLLKGIDVRQQGSGNIGAANVGRVLGKSWFFVVLALDAAKGALPMILILMNSDFTGLERIIVAGSTIAGNLFSPWVGFKGGKGIGTGLGVLLAMAPIPVLLCSVVFTVVLLSSNYVSLASMIAAVVLPVAVFTAESTRGIHHDAAFLLFCIVLAVALIIVHRANILRLANRTEPKFFARSRSRQ